jgi:hypothetical protein
VTEKDPCDFASLPGPVILLENDREFRGAIMTRCFITCFWGLVIALTLIGCAGHPLPENVARQSTYAIAKAIRCEAREAIKNYASNPGYDKGAIGFVFDFDITEHNNATLNFGLKKLFPSGTFMMNVPPSTDLKREAHRRFTIVDTFGELRQAKDCSPEAIQASFVYPIVGSVGLDEVIQTAIRIDQLGQAQSLGTSDTSGLTLPGGQAAVFSDILTYTTKIDTGAISPTATFNALPGVLRLTSINASFEADRTDVHTLTLAIALPNPLPSTPKGSMRAAAARAMPGQQPVVLGSRGIPSDVLIHGTPNTQVRVLWELDRRALLGQEDQLINVLGTTLHQ